MFIGRKKELDFLENKYKQEGGQLIVLYGRRRIGKTETLKEFCKNKKHIYYTCKECSDKAQLNSFSARMFKEDLPIKKYIHEFNDWEQAFSSIEELPFEEKKLMIIDEFPYMCKNNHTIPSILQNLWDNQLKNSNVMIILCGSSMSFIEKELLAEKNPLYGRATGIYKMKEMNFYEAIQFFPNYTNEDKVLVYSILGGVPHYLKQFDPNLSIESNIKKNILTKGCVLFNEVEFLLRQELRETSLYNSVIEAIAVGNTKLNEITQSSLINNTVKTNVYLRNLIELGLIERELSIDAKDKEVSNTNRGIYHITDNYFRFWYRFVYGNYSELEEGDVDGIYQYIIYPKLNEFASLTFENICKQYMREMQKKNNLPFRYEKIGRWFGKTTIRDINAKNGKRIDESEIDILAYSKFEHSYLIGECKYKNQEFKYSEYLDTIIKLEPLKNNNKFYYFLFSKSGFDPKLIELKDSNLYCIGLEEIINMTIN